MHGCEAPGHGEAWEGEETVLVRGAEIVVDTVSVMGDSGSSPCASIIGKPSGESNFFFLAGHVPRQFHGGRQGSKPLHERFQCVKKLTGRRWLRVQPSLCILVV